MEGAIVLLILILIAVFIVPVFFSWNTNSKVSDLMIEIRELKKALHQVQQTLAEPKPVSTSQEVAKNTEQPIVEKPPIVSPQPIHEHIPQVIPLEEKVEESLPEVQAIIPEPPVEAPIEIEEPSVLTQLNQIKPISEPPKPKKKTDFEQFIGEKLISLVGIGILVLGIFFTVKWAIDRNLITDAGKILIGLLAGTLLVGVAHRLSKNYRAFSSILAGGGVAVFYFSIYQAYQSYHLLPQVGAFAAMVVITIFAIILSLIYDKKEMAVIALVGGFATPFFVSNGSGNYQILFSYMLILNVGMFVLANFKKWNLLNWIGYAFTVLIFTIWTLNEFDVTKGHASGGLVFASLFYIVFFATLIIYNVKHAQKFAALEISFLLSNTFLYLGSGLYFLNHIQHGDYQGVFVIVLALFNFVFAYWFYTKQQVDKNLIFLLIALVLTFVSLAGPVQLDGNYITLFWACELVILFWLGTKSNLALLKNASLVVLVLTIFSLILDWQNNYYSVQINLLPIVFNKAFITGLVVMAALLLKLNFVKKENDSHLLWGILPARKYILLLEIVTVLVIYIVGFQELKYQAFVRTGMMAFSNMMLSVYMYLFVAGLIWYTLKFRTLLEQKWILGLGVITLIGYPIANYSIQSFRTIVLFEQHSQILFIWHCLAPIAALYIIYRAIRYVYQNFTYQDRIFKIGAWVLTAMTCFVLSAEIVHIWVYMDYNPGFEHWDIASRASKIAWPILWSLISLMLMWFGMKLRIKQFRIISLSLFTLTIVKLFAYDISNVSQGGKIAAFIILGVILLVVSFMYQKIKGLFVEDQVVEQSKSEQQTHE
jgi:uncharacterized membrane protein